MRIEPTSVIPKDHPAYGNMVPVSIEEKIYNVLIEIRDLLAHPPIKVEAKAPRKSK